jgi:N-methylhydantoinase B/oxoprolinase/acetone carboxylase alpha subunit
MLDVDIPLNAGCLVPLDGSLLFSASLFSLSFCGTVRIPSGSLLSPSRTAAVCGGNVLTSQRIVDVVLRAFNACAASQGCTNNLTFGAGGKDSDGRAVAGWGYYEVRICTDTYSVRAMTGHADNCGRFRGRPELAWNIGCPHAHNEHTYR